jgi:acetylornithine deacetylase/succinyl-diaminopimelate desuccinylase-like protein
VDDAAVHFTTLLPPTPPFESSTDTDRFRAVERAATQRDPGAFVTSSMMTGATDRPAYRKLGIVTQGLSPFKVEAAGEQTGVHGNDERRSVRNVGEGVKLVYEVLRLAQ